MKRNLRIIKFLFGNQGAEQDGVDQKSLSNNILFRMIIMRTEKITSLLSEDRFVIESQVQAKKQKSPLSKKAICVFETFGFRR